ncbi:MAG TPA: succinylglutamate desuccinylase/aspartoacylase family protein [Candidatus Competibacteraceae bacterium]|nr:succinylglutamate desuccinylase/aspartoacylase family protein [Candidatus Competibacteraceae bacterium]
MATSIEYIELPSSSPGTQRRLKVFRYGRPEARPKAYVQASLHADELPGQLVQLHLRRLLEQAEERLLGEVVVVPVANPVGLAQHLNGRLLGRQDFDGSGNFNRSYPDPVEAVLARVGAQLGMDGAANVALIRAALRQTLAQWPALREVEAMKKALLGLAIDADLVLDLHCDSEALLHLYASAHQQELAVELGAQLGAPTVLLESDPGGSPFDESAAGPWWKLRQRVPGAAIPLACFAATVELRGQADVDEASAVADALNIFRFLQRRGVVAGDPGPLPMPLTTGTPLDGVDWICAPAAGLIVYRKRLGERVEEGEVVAELVDPLVDDPAQARIALASRTAGLFFARLQEKLARPGQVVGKVAGPRSLPHREAGKLLEP